VGVKKAWFYSKKPQGEENVSGGGILYQTWRFEIAR
jgi:hypothetical protein